MEEAGEDAIAIELEVLVAVGVAIQTKADVVII
jgi:hypothetical protein